jgi:hypothetical protein
MNGKKADDQYEVLSPWAEVDPVPPRGISPRLTEVAGKKIGLFCNSKRAARPIMTVVEEKLKERFPQTELVWYVPVRQNRYNVLQLESENKERFEEWLNGVDAVVTALAD